MGTINQLTLVLPSSHFSDLKLILSSLVIYLVQNVSFEHPKGWQRFAKPPQCPSGQKWSCFKPLDEQHRRNRRRIRCSLRSLLQPEGHRWLGNPQRNGGFGRYGFSTRTYHRGRRFAGLPKGQRLRFDGQNIGGGQV